MSDLDRAKMYRTMIYGSFQDGRNPPFLSLRCLILLLIVHAGCGAQKNPQISPDSANRQDESTLGIHLPEVAPIRTDPSSQAPMVGTSGRRSVADVDSLAVGSNPLDTPGPESARSSVSSVSSLWGRDPFEELMNELPPCGTFPLSEKPHPISDSSRLDFRVRTVDFNSASEYIRLFDSYIRRWRKPDGTCPSAISRFYLTSCDSSVDFVIDEQRLNPIHGGVREYRAIAPGRNKVSVQFFDPSVDDGLLTRAVAADAAALTLLGGRVSPVLFQSSIPPSCPCLVHSYHGYHSLGDLREVASVPSTDLVLRLAVRGLELLRDMHQVGIVHGSINLRTLRYRKTPNVKNDDEIVSSLRLVDFWISSRLFVDVTRQALAPDGETSTLQPVGYMSIFQLESQSGHMPSPTRRDDLIGLAESLLMLAIGDYEVFELVDPEEVLARKRNLGFQAPGRVDARLYSLYKRAREMERTSPINYDQMIVSLR